MSSSVNLRGIAVCSAGDCRDRYLLCGVRGHEHAAVGETQFADKAGGRTVLGRDRIDRDDLTWPQATIGARQPYMLQHAGADELEHPVLNGALVVLRIEADV